MSATDDLLGWFEVHSVEGIREALPAGASPAEPIFGKKPIECLMEMYLRARQDSPIVFGSCCKLALRSTTLFCKHSSSTTMQLFAIC